MKGIHGKRRKKEKTTANYFNYNSNYKQTAKDTIEYFRSKHVEEVDWPSQSPTLNIPFVSDAVHSLGTRSSNT